MAFDTSTRNRLNKFVSDARDLLTDEFTNQCQVDYGMDPDTGEVADLERLSHLDDARRQTAIILRETLEHYYSNLPTKSKKKEVDDKQLIERIIREQAFTILNRLCAIRMAEARDLVIESVADGMQSKGFQLYQPVVGTSLRDTAAAYQQYLFSMFDEFAVDLPVLFDRFSPQGRLFPRESVLAELLELINASEINQLWGEDETIGWIYQYFNSAQERKNMRDASQAPRNSRELAVRNQFFTPRYVVEFLTDNTLGRIWYEMRKGETRLKDECKYLVRRPNEIFLAESEDAPEAEQDEQKKDLTQEELLNQPVHIPHRPLKDPREIRMLDPACGSMHFGLYAFDLYLKIYEEYWDLVTSKSSVTIEPTDFPPLAEVYPTRDAFLRDVPRLIIEHNIHGIDIDPRAVQIAGLSLWLRAQRAWKSQGLAAGDRPQVERSNVVCAEPMPGNKQQLEAFCKELHPAIAQMVTAIFEEMKLAGEAGSLLKIEQEISSLVAAAKKQYKDNPPDKKSQMQLFGDARVVKEQQLEFDLSGITDELFFEKAEEEIYLALEKYSSQLSQDGFRRKLFANDAENGFAFIELSRKRFDTTLMNPPFGPPTDRVLNELGRFFPTGRTDIAAAFILRGLDLSVGKVGAIVTRSLFLMPGSAEWREKILELDRFPDLLVDFGGGVLDAFVETAASVHDRKPLASSTFFDCREDENKATRLLELASAPRTGKKNSNVFLRSSIDFKTIPLAPFCYWVDDALLGLFRQHSAFEPTSGAARTGLATLDNFRFLRCWWETREPRESIATDYWKPLAKGGDTWPYFGDIDQRVLWLNNGAELKCFVAAKVGSVSRKIQAQEYYGRPGITWIQRSQLGFCPRPLPSDSIFDTKGPSAFRDDQNALLATIGIFSSSIFQEIVDLQVSSFSYHPGVVQRSPFPELTDNLLKQISECTLQAFEISSEMRLDETMVNFGMPHIFFSHDRSSLKGALSSLNSHYESSISDLRECARTIEQSTHDAYGIVKSGALEERCDRVANRMSIVNRVAGRLEVSDMVSWLLGAIFGRWDIRLAANKHTSFHLAPFAKLPLCPPGALMNASGHPITTDEIPENYPLAISNGILVDDDGHPQNIIDRTIEALELVWSSDPVIDEICKTLGVASLKDYFCKSNSFFADHLKRYSKSRRIAPIYWPISTESGSYTLWLYYHRLNDQTLYKAVNDFVDPKLKEMMRQLGDLRAIKDRSSAQEKEFAQLTEMEPELEQFKADLLQIAAFWKPNLNDGVQITAAPLWKFFRLTKWRNKLKKTWEELESGKYDWAHLALSIWPDRVVKEKCTTDRSIAIAHDLEEQLWHEVDVTKVSKSGRETKKTERQPKNLSNSELDAIVEDIKSGKQPRQTAEVTS